MTDLELLELLVQTRERIARELLKCCKAAVEIGDSLDDYWKNQAGGNE